MKLTRTALGAALLASSLAGAAYAADYGNSSDAAQAHRSNPVSKEQQQQYDQSPSTSSGTTSSGTSSSGTTSSGSMSSGSSSGDSSSIQGGAPPNPSNTRDRDVLDTNHDGVISPDEQKRVHPGAPGGLPSENPSTR